MGLPIITVCGNVQKIETRQTQGGKNITTVNVSCGDKNSKGEWENLYIKADFWEKQSDFVSQYFKEGSAIIVSGKLVTTNYTKQDGSKVYETKFLFPQASFVPKDKGEQRDPQNNFQAAPQGGYQTHPSAPQPTSNIPDVQIDDGNIPF